MECVLEISDGKIAILCNIPGEGCEVREVLISLVQRPYPMEKNYD
jgi:hypothetical protein